MSGDYTTQLDMSRHLIEAKISGYLDVETFGQFRSKVMAFARQLGGNHLVYGDLRECTVQSQDILALAQGMFINSAVPARKIAIIVKGSLQTMQARRVRVRTGIEIFDDDAVAKRWLFAAV